jgi:hypothetical protein
MALPGLGKLVWPGAILAGIALGAFVVLSWPDATTRTVRLPYGESAPKTPRAVESAKPAGVIQQAATLPPRAVEEAAPQEAAAPRPEEDPGRVLASLERDPGFAGPDPIPSDLELLPGYVRESPESLGAQPLPGAELTPAQPPVAR